MPSLSAELPFGKGVKPKRGLRDLIGSSRGRSASEASWTAGCACSFRSFSQWNILRGLQQIRSRPAASSRKSLSLREAAPPRSSRSFRASAVLFARSCNHPRNVSARFGSDQFVLDGGRALLVKIHCKFFLICLASTWMAVVAEACRVLSLQRARGMTAKEGCRTTVAPDLGGG